MAGYILMCYNDRNRTFKIKYGDALDLTGRFDVSGLRVEVLFFVKTSN